jgi:hypothetical protein
VSLLLGVELSGVGPVLARCFGIGLLALGISPGFRGMLLYNAALALYLGALGGTGQASGILLWPAVALHAGLALLLVFTRRNEGGGGGQRA